MGYNPFEQPVPCVADLVGGPTPRREKRTWRTETREGAMDIKWYGTEAAYEIDGSSDLNDLLEDCDGERVRITIERLDPA